MPNSRLTEEPSGGLPAGEQREGRELDALIAEKVMGFVWRRGWGGPWKMLVSPTDAEDCPPIQGDEGIAADYARFVPRYSTDLAAAWLVVEKLTPRFYVCVERVHRSGDAWNAWVGRSNVAASSAPLAICRAALAALSLGDTSDG